MSDDVARAIQSAKYGEIVQLTLADEGGNNTKQISLVAVLDTENGGVQWCNADIVETLGDSDAHLRRHLRTKRWFFPMLNDHKRNELFEDAIEKAACEVRKRLDSREKSKSTSELIHSLDIGSGTGLLAMLSALKLSEKASNHDIKVLSVEMSSAMASIARQTILSNSMQKSVDVQEDHSCEIPPLTPKAMLCTSELLESGLLAEGWVPAMRDAWERHLDPDAIVVPRAAKVFAQVVGGTGISMLWGPHARLYGFPEGRSLSLALDGDDSKVLLGDQGDGICFPAHIEKLLSDSSYSIQVLSSPMEVLDICVDSKNAVPTSDGQTCSKSFAPVESGAACGVIYWWELDLFEGTSKYNSGSGASDWQDHWQQCLYVFTSPGQGCVVLERGVPATLKVCHDDMSISFDVLSSDCDAESRSKKVKRVTQGGHSGLITPARAWQLNDVTRSLKLRASLKALLDRRGMTAPVLDISDFSLCAMMAALLGGSNVTSLEASSTRLPEAAARIAQISNGLPLEGSSFQLISCHAEQVTLELLGGSQAEIVVAEPYYEILEGWELKGALNYLYTLRALKRRNVVKNDALSMPLQARIMGQAFESHAIASAYQRCDSSLRGFSHDVANRLYPFSGHDIALPSWQYKITTLSLPFEIALIDYTSCTVEQSPMVRGVGFNKAGTCHGMVVWVDYILPTADHGRVEVLSTLGRPHHQLIRLIDAPVSVNKKNTTFCCRSYIGRNEGSMDDYTFQISVEKVDNDSVAIQE